MKLEKVDDELRTLLDDMLETMYAAPGIGLAAVQIGILKRLIVIDISKDQEKKSSFLINPEIILSQKNFYPRRRLLIPYLDTLQKLKDQLSVKLNSLIITGKKRATSQWPFGYMHTA